MARVKQTKIGFIQIMHKLHLQSYMENAFSQMKGESFTPFRYI